MRTKHDGVRSRASHELQFCMSMKVNCRDDLVLIVAQKIVLAIAGGIAIWLFPVLQNLPVYILWGPCLAVAFGWAYSSVRDIQSKNAKWQFSLKRGIVVGTAHLLAVSSAWVFVTKTLPQWL